MYKYSYIHSQSLLLILQISFHENIPDHRSKMCNDSN